MAVCFRHDIRMWIIAMEKSKKIQYSPWKKMSGLQHNIQDSPQGVKRGLLTGINTKIFQYFLTDSFEFQSLISDFLSVNSSILRPWTEKISNYTRALHISIRSNTMLTGAY